MPVAVTNPDPGLLNVIANALTAAAFLRQGGQNVLFSQVSNSEASAFTSPTLFAEP